MNCIKMQQEEEVERCVDLNREEEVVRHLWSAWSSWELRQ